MELVALLNEGVDQAFDELYVRYKGKLKSFYKSVFKNDEEAEDMVHDIFLHLWEIRGSLDIKVSFSGYIFTIAKTMILKKIRHFEIHARYAQAVLMYEKDWSNQMEDTILDHDFAQLLKESIKCLSPRQKEVFQLSRLQGLTYKEIAELTQLSVETVREHASLALQKIKKNLVRHADIHFKTIIAIFILFS